MALMVSWEYIIYGLVRALEALAASAQKVGNTLTLGFTDFGGQGTIFSGFADGTFSERDKPEWRSLGFATGGVVPETGMYQLHAGETVRRAEGLDADTQSDPRGQTSGVNNISINVTGALDASDTARSIMELMTQQQQRLTMR